MEEELYPDNLGTYPHNQSQMYWGSTLLEQGYHKNNEVLWVIGF